jgi:crossover junction endodeoxyribonuclease RusA
MTEHRAWTVELPAGMQLINANDRLHWAVKARLTKTIRDAAHICTRQAKVPRLERARVDFILHPGPQSRNRDRLNWAPTAKAAIDGAILDAGVLLDDSDRYLDGPNIRISDPRPKTQVVLRIFELHAEVK